MGQYGSDYLYEAESVRESRLMRGLTKRMNELGKQSKVQGISQKKEEQKPAQKNSESALKATNNSGGLKGASSMGLLNDQSDNPSQTGKLKAAMKHNSKDKLKVKSSVHESRDLPLEEIVRMTKLGYEWRKAFAYKGKMRSPSQKTRDVIFDNYTCNVRDKNKGQQPIGGPLQGIQEPKQEGQTSKNDGIEQK